MPNKLTDAEIVKAFQMCTLKAEHPGFVLCGQIVDLINRLQAENENLQEKNLNLTSDLTSLQNDLTSLQAENERLKEGLPMSASFLFEKAKLDELLTRTVEAESKFKNKIKAEAYKEFAEKICFEANKQINWHREGLSQTRRQGKSIENDKYIERCEGAIYAICYIRDCVHNLLIETESEENG